MFSVYVLIRGIKTNRLQWWVGLSLRTYLKTYIIVYRLFPFAAIIEVKWMKERKRITHNQKRELNSSCAWLSSRFLLQAVPSALLRFPTLRVWPILQALLPTRWVYNIRQCCFSFFLISGRPIAVAQISASSRAKDSKLADISRLLICCWYAYAESFLELNSGWPFCYWILILSGNMLYCFSLSANISIFRIAKLRR